MEQNHNRDASAEAEFRLIRDDDTLPVLELMEQSAFPISGLATRSLYKALCRDALSDDRMLIGVAACDQTIAGFLIVIVDWRAYWRDFLIRHPLVGVQIVWSRAKRGGPTVDIWPTLPISHRSQVEKALSERPSGRSWGETAPHIAKAVFLQIDPRYRQRGIAVRLYRFLFDLLIDRGVTRCDAKMDIANIQVLPLHQRMGYSLEKSGNTLFATRDLEKV